MACPILQQPRAGAPLLARAACGIRARRSCRYLPGRSPTRIPAASPGPSCAQTPFTPRRSPARPGAAPLYPGGAFGCPRAGVASGSRCEQAGCGMGQGSGTSRTAAGVQGQML